MSNETISSMSSDVESSSVDNIANKIAWFLIAIASIMQLARISGMTNAHGEHPFLSANDRSRWCAIAALTEDGKWEIERFSLITDKNGKPGIWNTIDMVRHRGPDGIEHSYSSKPPLLTLIYAAICKPITWIFGKKVTEEPFLIGRSVMVVVNLLPLILWWIWIQRWLERNVSSAWVRLILLNIALWGTFLTTFAGTINNHGNGAMLFTVSLVLLWRITRDARAGNVSPWWVWITSGVVAGLTVACELPALAWAGAAGLIMFAADWRRMLIGFGLGSASIAAAFLATNYWAHGDLRPPYSHRGLGPKITVVDNAVDASGELDAQRLVAALDAKRFPFTVEAKLAPARLENVLQLVDDTAKIRVAVKKQDSKATLYEWDDWYDYPKSYWLPDNKKGVDKGEPNRWAYLFHFLIGHHGVFSLTPIWLWSVAGAWLWYRRSMPTVQSIREWLFTDSALAVAISCVTLVCVVFYTSMGQVDRNYAGVCSGFRWLFWLIPGWLWLAVPAITASQTKAWSRSCLNFALLVSIFSATIPWPNPWTHPWPYRILIWLYPSTFQ